MLRGKCWWRLRMKGRILIILLTLIGILLFPSHAYSKYPILCKWEDNDRISIWVGGRKEIISKSTEGGESKTRRYAERPPIYWERWEKDKDTKKSLSFKEKGEGRLEVEVRNTDGSLIKKVVLGKINYIGMSSKENCLIYITYKNGKWTLWADPLIKDSSPIPVFTQGYDIRSSLSPDETKLAIIANDEKWGHSVLIVKLNDISNPIRVTTISESPEHSAIRSWSPSGTYIVYSNIGKAYLVSVDGTQKIPLTDRLDSDFFQWEGDKLYFIGDQMLQEVDILNPEKPRMLLKLPECQMWYLAELSPDKSKIAIVRRKPKAATFEIWWNYIYKDEPWKELYKYEQVLQKSE
jgi:Tol biopolymer transport system component